MYAGLVDAKGNLQLYDGGLRFRSAAGEIVEDQIAAEDYAQLTSARPACANPI